MPRMKRGWGSGSLPAGVGGGAGNVFGTLQTCHAELLTQRAQIDAQIDAIERALRVMGVQPPARRAWVPGRPGRPPGRGPRPGSLKSYILKVLGSGGVMAVKDITSAVTKAGYKTKNKTLAKSVGIALTELPSVVKVGRGKFRLR